MNEPQFEPPEYVMKLYEEWSKQGRTKEQRWAVYNFLTGSGRDLWAEREEVLKLIKDKVEESYKEKKRVLKLITEEIAEAHKAGEPTSRLTSLYNKL